MNEFIVGAVAIAGWVLGRSGWQVELMRQITERSNRRYAGRPEARRVSAVSLEAWHEPAEVTVRVD